MRPSTVVLFVCTVSLYVSCAKQPPSDPVVIDGSSTVFPLSEAVALDFLKANRGVQVNARFSGTVEGLQRFCRGRLDIVGASRPITRRRATAVRRSRRDFHRAAGRPRCHHHHREPAQRLGVVDHGSGAANPVDTRG